ncbi:unnamed protein product [Peronospora belbahrii]|uniref:HTH myb-type domain-containing protein n=1 Tax=Peronospora belbahrii TaxID=622444 RepID=A0AAU9L9W8_9STRA|nr:unnamed protein product [Peronospora belbahrii]CAH0518121.1 unnamed protein product [Peronospora belbahrii]
MWQQPTHPQHTSTSTSPPPSQYNWFALQKTDQDQSPTEDISSSCFHYTTSTSQDQRVYVYPPTYSSIPASTPPYVWTNESHSPPPPARTFQFLHPSTYPQPLYSADIQAQEIQLRIDQQPHVQTALRRSQQIAIGRWNNDEHEWFLKGLEMFQRPAWGEIAQLIGTRTSTQVRTHAQKFFTKLAKFNQTMPYFEVQIQRERARLVAQGASVTPTAQSSSRTSISTTTLSPRKHLVNNMPQQSLKGFKKEKSPTYKATVQTQYSQNSYNVKPRVYTDSIMGHSSIASPSVAKEWTQKWTTDDARQWPRTSPTSKVAPSFQLTQMHMGNSRQQNTLPSNNAEPDVDSLPPMNKLLYRSSTS